MVQIYALVDPRDQLPRYIGKAASAQKRFQGHMKERTRNSPVYRWIAELRIAGLIPSLLVIAECTDADWRECERAQIAEALALGMPLLNASAGGEQPTCPADVRAANGRKVAASRDHRLWKLKCALGGALKDGAVNETTKAKMRARPDVFGQFAAYL